MALTSQGERMSRRIVLTEHAVAEARRRGISEELILEVASSPEQRLEARSGREVCQSRVTDPGSGKLQLVRVFVDRAQDGDAVVTAYRTSKVRKYWRGE